MKKAWVYKQIGDVCTVERGGSPRPIDDYITDSPDGINWIKIGDTSDSMYIVQTAQKINPEGMKKSRYVQPGDFLLSNSMSFGRPYILKIDGCIHDGWLVLRDNDGVFDKRFLYYYLSAKPTYEKFKMMAVGGVVNNLNSSMVRKVRVPIPLMSEQIQIADILDKVNGIIESRKRELSILDNLIKARFVEMFGIVQNNVYGLDVGTLESVSLDFFAGGDKPADCSPEKDEVHLFPVYANGYENEGLQGYSSMCRVDKPSVTVSARGTIGCCFIRKAGFTPIVRLITIIPNDKVSVVFLKYAIDTMNIKSSGTSQAQLTVPNFKKEKIVIPSMKLQNEFAAFVTQIDKSKSVIQKSLDETRLLFDSLMQKYFC